MTLLFTYWNTGLLANCWETRGWR